MTKTKFSKKVDKALTQEEEHHGNPYEVMIIDADTPVFRAAKKVEEDYVNVTHIKSGKVKEFKNKTEFYGHHSKKSGGWLAETNKKREEKSLSTFSLEDFELEECVRLSPEIEDHVAYAVEDFDYFIGDVKRSKLTKTYKLILGGSDNFRYDLAYTLPYKGERKEKPLLFTEIKDAIIDKYSNYVEVVDGIEADDRMAYYGKLNETYYKEHNEWKYLLAFIDKDIKMVYSPHVNYNKFEEGVTKMTKLACVKHYATQLISGDLPTDNIQGIPKLTSEFRKNYGLREGKGVGFATAEKIFKDMKNPKEIFEAVVEAYKDYYGTEPFEMDTHRGDTIEVDWLDMLQETVMLIRMHPEDKPTEYHITKLLKALKVDYE